MSATRSSPSRESQGRYTGQHSLQSLCVRRTLDVVAEHLPVALGTALPKTLASLASSRHFNNLGAAQAMEQEGGWVLTMCCSATDRSLLQGTSQVQSVVLERSRGMRGCNEGSGSLMFSKRERLRCLFHSRARDLACCSQGFGKHTRFASPTVSSPQHETSPQALLFASSPSTMARTKQVSGRQLMFLAQRWSEGPCQPLLVHHSVSAAVRVLHDPKNSRYTCKALPANPIVTWGDGLLDFLTGLHSQSLGPCDARRPYCLHHARRPREKAQEGRPPGNNW